MKTGPLHLQDLDRNYLVVVQLKTQPPGALQQVTLRPDKIHDGLIRLGETPDDEARCWIAPENVIVEAIIGVAVENDGKWSCRPMLEVVTADEAYAMACP
jgi:hypothetical protein